MSDVKHHVNAKTSILIDNRAGSFCVILSKKNCSKCHKMASCTYRQQKSM